MANFSLDDIRSAAEAKYGSTDIDLGDGTVVCLMNPLRLPKAKRDQLSVIQEEFSGDDVDAADVFARLLVLVASNQADAKKLLKAVGDDLATLSQIFETYTSGTQLGEASASES